MSNIRSILDRLPVQTGREVEVLALKRRAWRDHGQAVLDPRSTLLDHFERTLIERVATRIYGPSPRMQPPPPKRG